MVIKNDINGINNARMLQTSNKAQSKSMEKLASGNKVNKGADDAAGLAISEKMMKQIQGINKAIDNASDGMAMTDVADGGIHAAQDALRPFQRQQPRALHHAGDLLFQQVHR